MSDSKIFVNKGHFDLDTHERKLEFHRKMAFGWESEYNEYRKAWEENPQKKIIRDYPLEVTLELSTICNLQCPMCYTNTEEFNLNVSKKFMDYELFKNVVDEIAGKVFSLRLSWRGEPTLHPNFLDCIKYAKKCGIKEVSFLTNGSTLTSAFSEEIIKAGADWITISIDGIGKIYNTIRKPLLFHETLEKLKFIKSYKKKLNINKPVIKIQTVWPAIRNAPDQYYNTLKPFCDLLAFNPLIDYLGKDDNIIFDDNFSCPQLYERVFVASNGDIMMCNSDEYGKNLIGNAVYDSIHQVWHCAKLMKVRELHNMENGFLKIQSCKKCYYPRKTEVSEYFFLNGKKISVENYINRKQIIGE